MSDLYSADEIADHERRMAEDLDYRIYVGAQIRAARVAKGIADKAAPDVEKAAQLAADRDEANQRFRQSVGQTTEAPRASSSASGDAGARGTGTRQVTREDINREIQAVLDRKFRPAYGGRL